MNAHTIEIERLAAKLASDKPTTITPGIAKAEKDGPAVSSIVTVRLSDVDAVCVRWLWRDRIPLGRVTVLAGVPGAGKSFLGVDFAARVSRGRAWPDETPCPQGDVLLLVAEDDLGDTVKPRLNAADADCTKVVALEGVRQKNRDGKVTERGITLADHDAIIDAVDAMPNCRLIVLDPIGSYLGSGVDSHRDNEVRGILSGLAKLARDRDIAVVIVAHYRKGGAGRADDAILASVAFSGLARSVLHVMPDPDDPMKRRKLLAAGKCNLAPPSSTLAWEISLTHGGPAVGWIGPVETSADAAMERNRERPGPPDDQFRRAVDWLNRRLADGPVLMKDVKDEWEHGEGGSARTLERAKTKAKVKSFRIENPGPWYWRLEGTSPHRQSPRRQKEFGGLGDVLKTPQKTDKNTTGTHAREHNAKSLTVGSVPTHDTAGIDTTAIFR